MRMEEASHGTPYTITPDLTHHLLMQWWIACISARAQPFIGNRRLIVALPMISLAFINIYRVEAIASLKKIRSFPSAAFLFGLLLLLQS